MPFDTIAHTELAEKQSDSILPYFFQSIPDAAFVLSPEGILLDANAAFFFRYTGNEERLGINAFDLLPPKLAVERLKMLQEAVRTAKTLSFDDNNNDQLIRSTIYPHKSAEGKVDRLLIIAQDITDIGQLLKKEQFINKHIINSIPGTFYMLDANGKFVLWNEHVRVRSYGVTEDEMAETFGIDIFHPDDRGRAIEALQNVIHNDVEVLEEFRVMPRGEAGIEWRIMTGKRILIDGAPFVIGVGSDITERKLEEAELERLNRVLVVSDQCNKALIQAENEQELLQKICSIIVDFGGYRMAWVGFAQDDEAKSLPLVASAGCTGDYFESITISWGDNQYGQGPAGTAVRTGQPFSVNHILTDPQFNLWRNRAIKNGYAAVLGLPLSIDNCVVGALTIYSEEPDAFNDAETLQLTSLADNLAFGIKTLRQSEALKISEKRFRTLFDANTAIMLLIDPRTGNIVDANNAAADFYGWSVKELKKMAVTQINPMTPSEEIKRNFEQINSTGRANFSFRDVKKNGSLHDVEVFATKIDVYDKELICAIVVDVSEQKRYEQINALRFRILQMADTHTVEELLTTTLDDAEKLTGSEIGFVFFVAEDQNSLFLQTVSTNTFENMCKAEGKGLHYPLDKAGVWADAVREKKAVIHNDYPALKHRNGMPEGHAEIVRELVIPVNRDGKVVAIMGVGNKPGDYDDTDIESLELIANHTWDIVAKKIADEEKKKLAEQLQQAMKMETIGQLSAGIAHEINNPLNYITLNEYNLQDDFADLCLLVGQYRRIIENFIAGKAETKEVEQLREKERELNVDKLLKSIPETLENSKSGIERITAITRSMKSYSFKNADEQLFLFDLNKAIHEAVVIAKHEYSNIATVGLQLEELPQLLCNPPQISQVILNLIINSSHAIKSQNRASLGKIEITTWTTDEGVFCSVTDDGPGIAESVIKKVFEPFFTTKEPGKGTGLGLSISYDIIVNKHKGSLSAACLPEGGTVFTFSLPKKSV